MDLTNCQDQLIFQAEFCYGTLMPIKLALVPKQMAAVKWKKIILYFHIPDLITKRIYRVFRV